MENNNLKKILSTIFIAALFLRLFTVISQDESMRLPYSDAKDYDNIAMNIVSGHGLSKFVEGQYVPTTFRTPMYPVFLAGAYSIFGHNYTAVKIIQVVLGALFCIVIFFVSYFIYNNKVTALIAAIITAIYKPFVSGFYYYGGPAFLVTEELYMFLIGLTLLTLILFIKKENKRFGILTGVLAGLTILTRPEFIVYPFILLFYLFHISKWSLRNLIRKYFIVYLFLALALTPWITRNYIAQKKFIPLTTYGGFVFCIGNNSLANGGWSWPDNYNEIRQKTKGLSEYETSRVFFEKGIKDLKNNPGRIPMFFIKKILVHWAPFEEGFRIFNPYYAFILLFGAIGILFFRRRGIMEGVLLSILISTTLTALIIYGDPRYRYPYDFVLIIFTALAMNEFFIIMKRKFLIGFIKN